MHPCPGNWVAIGRAVMYLARAAKIFSAGFKCRHCNCTTFTTTRPWGMPPIMAFYYPVLVLYKTFLFLKHFYSVACKITGTNGFVCRSIVFLKNTHYKMNTELYYEAVQTVDC